MKSLNILKPLSLKEYLIVIIIGCVSTPLALVIAKLFVHFNKFLSIVILFFLAPSFIILSKWGKGLTDIQFLGALVIAQFIYWLLIYLLLKRFFFSNKNKEKNKGVGV